MSLALSPNEQAKADFALVGMMTSVIRISRLGYVVGPFTNFATQRGSRAETVQSIKNIIVMLSVLGSAQQLLIQ